MAQSGFMQLFLGAPKTRQGHLDALDGLRGLAMIIVIVTHLANTRLIPPEPGLAGSGKPAIYLFFVLSAYLLTRYLLKRPLAGFKDADLWIDMGSRRVLRIWPLYLFVLLLSWALTMAGVSSWHYQVDTASLWRHLTLQEGQSVFWSIPVEFIFYLWLPPLAFGLAWMREKGLPLWAELAVLVLALAAAYWKWPPSEATENNIRVGQYLAVFLCGTYAARLDEWIRGAGGGPRWLWGILGLLGLAAWIVAIPSIFAWLLSRPYDRYVSHYWFIYYGVLWSVVLLALLHGPDWLKRPFQTRLMRLFGVISFSAYLWHMPILQYLASSPLVRWPVLTAVVILFLSVVVAMVSFLLIERPLRDVRVRRRKTVVPPDAGSPAPGTQRSG